MRNTKKLLYIVAVIAAMFTQNLCAQNVRVFLKDGTSQTFLSAEVDSVVFDADDKFYPTAVDLGLSVKWASCNLGAELPQEAGDFYSWGETSTKEQYTKATYFDKEFKYFSENNDTCFAGKTKYDAATAAWGAEWRTPTSAELQELITKCKWKSIRYKGSNGFRITGPNGNQIFMPSAGYISGKSLGDSQNTGYYWSSCLSKSYEEPAYMMCFSTSNIEVTLNYKYLGCSIRPVKDYDNK